MNSEFANLHTHSHYSLLEALPKIPDLVAAAAKDGERALALTDNGNMYGAIEFYTACRDNAVKPIIGVDFFVAPRTRFDKEHRVDDSPSRLVLLAKNFEGYRNLMHLVTKSHLEGFFHRPRIDQELVRAHAGGLLALLPSHGGEVAYALRHKDRARASRVLSSLRDIFREDCWIEITSHTEIEGHERQMRELAVFAGEHGIPVVAAQDTYYLSRADALACDLVNKIRTGGVLNREGEEYVMKDFSFRTQKTMLELFKDIPEALENVEKVVESCDLTIPLGKWVFPDFQIPAGSSHDAELRALSYQGLPMRGFPESPEIKKRVDYELSVIAQKGYSSYFLVMADLLREARKRGIFTNTRGSAAGSLVSYLCGITTVDPIAFNMPFERFLNPSRPSPPDIDLDLADNRRDELIDYIRGKYGETHVAQIGTFGTMMARAAVRDVARALGHSYGVGDRIAKMIPFGKQGFPVYIDGSLKSVPELKEAYERDPDAREVLDLAQKIEGNVRHVGVHAAGVFITPLPITEYVPIQLDPKGGKIITQYDMYSAGEDGLGLLKFDLLGLTNLSVLADSVERVRVRLKKEIDLEKIPIDDKRVYEMLSRGETLGVFQFSGSGMTNYLSELRPTTIHDLNAMVALYRPGPMAFIPLYIERKHNPKLVKYLDPRLEAILKDSYGILIYQDDLLLIASEIAGYSLGEADKFRRAVGKKIPAEMAAQKERFQKGCVDHGMKKETAQKLWEQIETFAAYGFNKCLTADTPVARKRPDGVAEDVPLAFINSGDIVASLDESSGSLVWRKVESKNAMGRKQVLAIRAGHASIRATGNHPMLMRNPGGRPLAYPALLQGAGWVDASLLRRGDFVAARKPRLGIFIDDANMFYGQKKNGWRVNYKRLARLLGHIYDVRLMHYHIVVPSMHDTARARSEEHIRMLKSRYGSIMEIKEKPLKYIWDAETKTRLRKGNVDGEIMLDAIAHADGLDAVAIVSGDSDYRTLAETLSAKGKECFFIGFENTMAWELRQMRHLYLNRLRDFLEALPPEEQKAPAEAGVPLLLEALYFPHEYLSTGRDFLWVKIESIEPAKEEEVWDIGVEETHSFLANGLVVHNSHAVSYGNLSYKTAYMKANFPVDYMAAVLTADAGDVEKIAEVVAECARMGIKILPPSVNESFGTFTVTDDTTIRFGLYSIKNFGTGVADSIITARSAGGAFLHIGDLLSRIPNRNLNKKSIEALIKSGALDELGERGNLLRQIDVLLEFHREVANISRDQDSLFGTGATKKAELYIAEGAPATVEERLSWEKELLGLYVSGHPLDKYKEKLSRQKMTIREAREKFSRGVETVIAGMLENVRPVITKNGERMLFGRIADYSGGVEIVAFPRVFAENAALFAAGSCLMVKGKFTVRNGEASFIIEKVKTL